MIVIKLIPQKCFNGDVTVLPSPPSVCAGDLVTLSYTPSNDVCNVASYTWMNGNDNMGLTTPTIQVSTPGFYWVKVSSSAGCTLETPSRITPVFKNLPTLEFPSIPSVCSTEAVAMYINTNATSISWTINNVLSPSYANQTNITIPAGMPPGTYPVSVKVTSTGGCSRTATQTFTIGTTPAIPTIVTSLVSCEPYSVQLTATGSSGSYNWSTGENTATIIVNEGGPYALTVTSGGCSVLVQTDVPKSPESLLWVFPVGCYNSCDTNVGTLIGPRQPVRDWEWSINTSSVDTGIDFVNPLDLTISGVYNLTLDTGLCSMISNDLNYSITECSGCPIMPVVDRVEIVTDNYCSATVFLTITNNSGGLLPVTFSNATNNVILSPASFNLNPGPNPVIVTAVPINGFLGGLVTVTITGYDDKSDKICATDVSFNMPVCGNISEKTTGIDTHLISLVIAPNPSKETTSINYVSTTTPYNRNLYYLR